MAKSKRGPYRVGVERRRRIIEVADRRFSTEGYQQTQLAAIAREAGVTDAGLLFHFPSKLHLLMAVTQARFVDADEDWAKLGEEPSFLAILAQMWKTTYLEVAEPARVEMDAIVAAESVSSTSPASAEYAAGLSAAISDTAGRFRRCLERGELRPDVEPEYRARQFFAMGNGLNAQWVISQRSFDLSAMMLEGLARLASAVVLGPEPPGGMAAEIRRLALESLPDADGTASASVRPPADENEKS
jgi:AcrR family transcriptional regulator